MVFVTGAHLASSAALPTKVTALTELRAPCCRVSASARRGRKARAYDVCAATALIGTAASRRRSRQSTGRARRAWWRDPGAAMQSARQEEQGAPGMRARVIDDYRRRTEGTRQALISSYALQQRSVTAALLRARLVERTDRVAALLARRASAPPPQRTEQSQV